MSEYSSSSGDPEVSVGAITFAGVMLIIIGTYQLVAGLTAIIDDEFFIVTQNYTFDLDVTAWGWVHFLIGLGMVATGFGLFTRATWAGVGAVAIAALCAIANFFFIPYYPFWSILVIALCVWVIYGLTRPGAIRT
jgi:hypothetical protein